MNGFATQGGPPAAAITYPFESPVDPRVTVEKQVSGQKTFDINAHGTAHYGLYPDWTEAVRVAGGDAIIEDLANGAEAYLQMWERARGEFSTGGAGSGQSPAGGAKDPCPQLRAKLKRAKAKGKPRKVQRKLRSQLRKAGCKVKKKKKKGKERKRGT
jgi:hypothetical protein